MSQPIATPILTPPPAPSGGMAQGATTAPEPASGFAALVEDAAQNQSGGPKEESASEPGMLTGLVKKAVSGSADDKAAVTPEPDQALPSDAEERQPVATVPGEIGEPVDHILPVKPELDELAQQPEPESEALLAQLAALDNAKRQMDGAELKAAPVLDSGDPKAPVVPPVDAVLPVEPGSPEGVLVTGVAADAEQQPVVEVTAKAGVAPLMPGQARQVGTADAAIPAQPSPTGKADLIAGQRADSPTLSVMPESRVDQNLGGTDGTLLQTAGKVAGEIPQPAVAAATPASALSSPALLAQAQATTPEPGFEPGLDDGTGLELESHRPLSAETTHRPQNRPTGAVAEAALMRQPVAAERLAPELRERLAVMINTERMSAELRLDPPELGALQVRIQMNGDQAQVQIQTQHAQARDLLEQALPRLREMLQGQGIQLADANVSQQQESGNGSGNGSGETGGQSSMDASGEEVVAHQISNRNAEGGIDFYA
ncbi:flagellar hook-length control protein FliK [Marinobacter hydrocarbonoclasticus]|nr:flagellar hook-length control protein FliK [Marinobacter nauticus]